jgi:hypothetical protein
VGIRLVVGRDSELRHHHGVSCMADRPNGTKTDLVISDRLWPDPATELYGAFRQREGDSHSACAV